MSDELNMAMMQDIVSSQNAKIDELYKERDKAQGAARKALALLRDVEWQYFDSYGPQCPKCHIEKDLGHRLNCALAEAIKELEEAL